MLNYLYYTKAAAIATAFFTTIRRYYLV